MPDLGGAAEGTARSWMESEGIRVHRIAEVTSTPTLYGHRLMAFGDFEGPDGRFTHVVIAPGVIAQEAD